MSDDEGLKDNEIQVEADIENKSIDTISKGTKCLHKPIFVEF